MTTTGAVTLREITDANRAEVLRLAVAPEQTGFVDGVAASLAEAAATPDARPWCRAVYADETPVGFVMVADGVPPGHPQLPWPYYLWRLLIDARHQRRGYGTAALALVVAYVRSRPGATELVTSAVAGDGSPIPFYERSGFHPTGGMLDHEHVYVLPLGGPGQPYGAGVPTTPVTTAVTSALPTADSLVGRARAALTGCGLDVDALPAGPAGRSPITGTPLVGVARATPADVTAAVARAHQAYATWRLTPAPVRGALVKRLGEMLTEHQDHLAALVQLEVGKTTSEARGEVQEMVDVCDLAVGLSRQLYGRTMPSERPGHRLVETWHPLGVVGVITAFNFPVAVWSWNTAIALVCGDPVVWKPAEQAPLCALACTALLERAAREQDAPAALGQVVLGGVDVAEALVDDERVALVSATGSVGMGRAVGPRVAARFGRALLELGGNNAAVVAPSADLDLAVRGIVFAAAGTAGQRCTSLRRVVVHEDVADELVRRLTEVYERLAVGDPAAAGVLVGPLVNQRAYESMQAALARVRDEGGDVLTGGARVLVEEAPEAWYVRPALVRAAHQDGVVREETFAPLLYVLTYRELDEAIALNNGVPQGLSSAIFTRDQREAERFLAADGSDCGIANVNIGTSGAEIGGAFGGEKETGGGRESGSDAWRAYMRRATNTVNYSADLPLAQGVDFAV